MIDFRWTLVGWLALAADAGAQTPCYAENDGPAFEDASSTSTAHFGIRFTPNVDALVVRAEVFTGESSGQHSIAIHAQDAVNDQPGAALGQGSFAVATQNGWQGALLVPPVSLQSGQTYWLVWGTTAGSQTSIDLPQAFLGQVFRVSVDGGQTWNPPFQSTDRHFKFRLLCDCAGPGVEHGAGCPGTGGFVPHLALDDCPMAGGTVSITISQGLGGANALVLFGLNEVQVPIGFTGCDLLISPVLPLLITVPLAGAGQGGGSTTLTGALPPSASGITLHVQAFVIDPGGAKPGFAATNGIEMKVP